MRVVDRINKKWETAKSHVLSPEFYQKENRGTQGILFFRTTTYAALEAMDRLKAQGIIMDSVRVRSFPFNQEIEDFIQSHDEIFVIEQNRDAQFRSLLINELEVNPTKLISVLNYDGMAITASKILQGITKGITVN
ncbi:MAG: hypothetical protein R2825_19695 [Saprospiraceae bacterium]